MRQSMHPGLVAHEERHLGIHGRGPQVSPRRQRVLTDEAALAGRHLPAEEVTQRQLHAGGGRK